MKPKLKIKGRNFPVLIIEENNKVRVLTERLAAVYVLAETIVGACDPKDTRDQKYSKFARRIMKICK